MALLRTHVLLVPKQQRLLANIAHREGHSVSEVAREIIQQGQGIAQRQQEYFQNQERQLAALERAHKLRQEIRLQSSDALNSVNWVNLLHEMREERDAELLSHSR